MSLEQVQEIYNVDTKEEAIAIVLDWQEPECIQEIRYNEFVEHGFSDSYDFYSFTY